MTHLNNASLQSVGPEHWQALQRLSDSVGWHFESWQARMFLTIGGAVFGYFDPDGSDKPGNLLATAGLYRYDPGLAALGNVIVDPDVQRRGLGRQLVQRCLAVADAWGTPVSLVATAQGAPLYRSLGFREVGQIHRLEWVPDGASDRKAEQSTDVGSGAGTPMASDSSRVAVQDGGAAVIAPSAVELLIALDADAMGGDRRAVYEALVPHVRRVLGVRSDGTLRNLDGGASVRAYRAAMDASHDARYSGFAMVVHRQGRYMLGPVIAPAVDVAVELVRDVLAQADDVVRIDVPAEHTTFLEALEAFGFAEVKRSPCMLFGSGTLPGRRERLFATLEPALG